MDKKAGNLYWTALFAIIFDLDVQNTTDSLGASFRLLRIYLEHARLESFGRVK